jgi:hypothetical protein
MVNYININIVTLEMSAGVTVTVFREEVAGRREELKIKSKYYRKQIAKM